MKLLWFVCVLKSINFDTSGRHPIAVIFQPRKTFAGVNKTFYQYFIFGRYPNVVKTFLFLFIAQRALVIHCGRFFTTYRSRLHTSGIRNFIIS